MSARWRGAAIAAAGLLVVIALVDPRPVVRRDVYRHLLVFDITQSMNVADAGPAERPLRRIEFGKRAVLDALPKLPCGSQLGVALFTGHRSLVMLAPVEVCAHYGELGALIGAIDWRMAWAARSEVSKGVHSALAAARALADPVSLVFFTDGHEAPPLHPSIRPQFRGTPGEIAGVLAGVGGPTPLPIPKLNAEGRPLGVWGADEVMQTDVFSAGRAGSVGNEAMTGVGGGFAGGREELSALREAHLRQLAGALGLHYERADSEAAVHRLLTLPALAVATPAATDLRGPLASAALLALLGAYAAGVPAARRRGGRAAVRGAARPAAVTAPGRRPRPAARR